MSGRKRRHLVKAGKLRRIAISALPARLKRCAERSVLAKSAPSLPPRPSTLQPDQRTACRASEEGYVLREQQDAERQHPKAQNRKEADHSPEHQEYPQWNADPSGGRLAQPPKRSGNKVRQRLFDTLELALEPFLIPVSHDLHYFLTPSAGEAVERSG